MPIRQIRRLRTKKKLNYNHPVILVFRSNQNISAQLLEPVTKKILFTINSSKIKTGNKTEKAVAVGKEVAKKLKDMKYDRVLFDRNGFIYHGRIKAVADSIREEKITI